MKNIMLKNARIKQEQDDADREAWEKMQKDNATRNMMLTGAGLYKDLKESHEMSLMQQTYDDNVLGTRPPKFERKDPRSIGEVLTQPKETLKRLLPGKLGAYQETEGYKEFQVKEAAKELDRARATVPIAEDTEIDVMGQDYAPPSEAPVSPPGVPLPEELAIDDPIAYERLEIDEDAPPLAPEAGPSPDYTKAFDSYTMLDRSGIKLPEGMSQENKIRIMIAFDKVVEEGDAQDYKAFTDTLKKGLDNPGMFEAVVTDLTENTDQTIQSVIEGTYTPGQEPIYRQDIPEAPVVEEAVIPEGIDEPFQEEYYGGVDPSADTLPLTKPEYAPEQIQELQRQADLYAPTVPAGPHIYSPAEIDEYGNIRDTTVPPPATPPDYEKIQAGADIAQDQQLQRLRDIEATPGVAPTVSADPDLEKALEDLEGLKAPKVKGVDEVLPEQLRASVGMSDMPDVEAPITDVEVPDAKPGGKFGGKTLSMLQTGQQMLNIGKTLTDEEASGEDRTIAGTQGVKMLADLAAKKAGQQTASQIGTKAASDYFAEKGLQEGVKMGGKAAVGAAAGGILGGYTMVAEGKEAAESWEEGDYDEAILHGISSVSGGLQTAGAGMMLSGVGAPIGAVLYGIGTAASVISSGAQLLEGLFGGSDAPAQPEVKKPKFNTSRFLQSIGSRSGYAY